MGEEPTWAELLVSFLVMGVIPTVVGVAVIVSLVGLTLWGRALLRRRSGRTVSGGN
ncbi:hypothetical protein ACIQPT_12390 [Streptomyces sp. NPDC091289]|uniref:hypothetical protein n=1 Tax=Streptomyces sp. NPDC091289 TaxID=3365989 RepID=UPI00381F4AF0